MHIPHHGNETFKRYQCVLIVCQKQPVKGIERVEHEVRFDLRSVKGYLGFVALYFHFPAAHALEVGLCQQTYCETESLHNHEK